MKIKSYILLITITALSYDMVGCSKEASIPAPVEKEQPKIFATLEKAAVSALLAPPPGRNVNIEACMNDSVHKSIDIPATHEIYKNPKKYYRIDLNSDGNKEFIAELNSYVPKYSGKERDIEGTSGIRKWAIIQKDSSSQYIIIDIQSVSSLPIIYSSKTNGWYDIITYDKTYKNSKDGFRLFIINKLEWNGKKYKYILSGQFRQDHEDKDLADFYKKAKLGNRIALPFR